MKSRRYTQYKVLLNINCRFKYAIKYSNYSFCMVDAILAIEQGLFSQRLNVIVMDMLLNGSLYSYHTEAKSKFNAFSNDSK